MKKEIYFCKCGAELKETKLLVDNKDTKMIVYKCSICNIVNIPGTFIKDLKPTIASKRSLADSHYRDTFGRFPGEVE